MKTTCNNSNSYNFIYLALLPIILISLLVRLAFFNGPIGSDEIVYLARSLDVANGQWSSANYNGALRYGYNIPEGLIIYIFGLNMFTANLWPLSCSLMEITIVFLFAWKYISNKAALFSALLLAFMPLHVAVSTRLHADPVVSFFLTLSFITFYAAERQTNKNLYFLSGIFLGCVFWVKELAALTFFAFLLYPILIRNIKSEWTYLILGGLVMLLAHLALMEYIAGDPLHLFKTVLGQLNRSFIGNNQGEDSPWYYFRYLFFDIKHTWLSPLIAISAVFFFLRSTSFKENSAIKYTFFWLISLLLVLSFFPVSLNPLRFAMKQSNYITLFLAPITLIAGASISAMPRKTAFVLTAITVAGGLALSGLEQQAYRVFTANSRGLLEFAETHQNHEIFGSVNNGRIACFYQILNGKTCNNIRIHDFSEKPAYNSNENNNSVFTVIDRETLAWGEHDIKIDKIPTCWHEIDTVTPASTGNSHLILDFILSISKYLPPNLATKIQAFQNPKPAKIYMVNYSNLWCTQ